MYVAEEEKDPERAADIIASTVTGYCRRFYPSESALPLRKCLSLYLMWDFLETFVGL